MKHKTRPINSEQAAEKELSSITSRRNQKVRSTKDAGTVSTPEPQEEPVTQLRFNRLSEEDGWIISGVRRARLCQTGLSKKLLNKYLKTKDLKKKLAKAKEERRDLLHQFEKQERDLEKKLAKLEEEFSQAAKDFSQVQEMVLNLSRKFSEIMGTDFRADVEEIFLAFRSLSSEERARVNQELSKSVDSWEPQQKQRLYALIDGAEESGED